MKRRVVSLKRPSAANLSEHFLVSVPLKASGTGPLYRHESLEVVTSLVRILLNHSPWVWKRYSQSEWVSIVVI